MLWYNNWQRAVWVLTQQWLKRPLTSQNWPMYNKILAYLSTLLQG